MDDEKKGTPIINFEIAANRRKQKDRAGATTPSKGGQRRFGANGGDAGYDQAMARQKARQGGGGRFPQVRWIHYFQVAVILVISWFLMKSCGL